MRVVTRASISSQSRARSCAQEPGVEKRIERVDRQAQALEDEKGGLVERRRRAVAEGETGGEKAADRVAQPVSRGEEGFDPLVVRLRQGEPPAVRRSSTALAFAQDAVACCVANRVYRPFLHIRLIWRTACRGSCLEARALRRLDPVRGAGAQQV